MDEKFHCVRETKENGRRGWRERERFGRWREIDRRIESERLRERKREKWRLRKGGKNERERKRGARGKPYTRQKISVMLRKRKKQGKKERENMERKR